MITITSDNTKWAQTQTAQIEGIEGYTIRYTLDGTDPTATTGTEITGTGTQEITMDRENCKVRAIYINEDTGKVTDVGISEEGKIDKVGPEIKVKKISNTYSECTVEWDTSDQKSRS